MRNYGGITDLRKPTFLSRLKYFDDEYFVLLKRNVPSLIAYPTTISDIMEKTYHLNAITTNYTELQRKPVAISGENTVIHIINGNKPEYNLIKFDPEISAFIERTLNEMNADEIMSTLVTSKNNARG